MANPNLLSPTTINGVTTYYTPSGTTAVVLLANAASSGKVYKINQIVATNVNGSSAVNATVSILYQWCCCPRSAPSGGTAYPIASTISVPANAALIVVDKTTQLYLQEGTSISITSGTASGLTFSISYEDIS